MGETTHLEDPALPWGALARVPEKRRLYEDDIHFRVGLADLTEAAGGDSVAVLRKLALLLVKPDGLAAGKAGLIIDFVMRHGFELVAYEAINFEPHHWRELWRYQLNTATLDRLAVNEIVLRGRALLLLLRHPAAAPPATVRLSALKGPSDVSRQAQGCLRRILGQPNRVLSLLHVADEPADLVRELALLLDPPVRRRLWQRAVTGETSPSEQLDREVESSNRRPQPMEPEAALDRVEAAIHAARDGPERDRALHAMREMRAGRKIDWRSFERALENLGANCGRWDLAILGSTFIDYDRPGTAKLIGPGDSRYWTDSSSDWWGSGAV